MLPTPSAARLRAISLFTAICGAVVLSGCAGLSGPQADQVRGLRCVDDSPSCVKARLSALDGLMKDDKRDWVYRPAPPESYASGVRLFAFKKKKRELKCDQLAIGRKEAAAGPGILRGSAANILSPAQISRGIMLSTEVSRELDKEFKRRCKA